MEWKPKIYSHAGKNNQNSKYEGENKGGNIEMNENKIFKKLMSFTIVLTMCLSILVILPVSAATTVWVDDDFDDSTPGWQVTHFDNIQDGVDNVESGGTVNVYSGTYASVVIDKTIDLIGEDESSTYLDGAGTGDTVSIIADWVNFSGFTVFNSGPNTDDAGIDILSSFNTIMGCYIYMNGGEGIRLVSASGNTIENCEIFSNGIPSLRRGIVLLSNSNNNIITDCDVHSNSIGIDFFYSPNNNVTNCRAYSNAHSGIYIDVNSGGSTVKNSEMTGNMYGIILYATYNTITGCDIGTNQYGVCTYYSFNSMIRCNISDNDYGISFYSSNNTVTECDITNNNLYGIYAYSSHPDNHMYHNNFVGNTYQAHDGSSNTWDDGYPPGGNYWDNFDEPSEGAYDDYSGINQDVPGSDGIVDTPYNISGGSNQDLYPLMNPWAAGIEEVLDVSQIAFDRGFPIRHAIDGDWGAAQNFTAIVDTITRVEVYLRKFGTPEFDLTVELRTGGPEGTLLDTVVFAPGEVTSNWAWLNIDFNDVTVTPGTDYFIVCPPAPSGVTTSFGYEWGYAFGNQYDDGAFWFTRDGGGLWRDLPTMYEFVFRTYGYD